ncbi:proline--tRNA ligase [Segniliparus rugosus]|uniref:Proline--tRNA ligase n=1 Tax=Segniliparus rugosus (strain ATCC BAA-974 / DSM 45345 / CCUG 50838 / CIP 108380 / JCM 13579 / CDC 945) TaxID=679197 RepID=E5XST5_SEGRC|nr:proline--tRNA ligase [Segniliparus rugosus]EFV12612.1 prolyl-tRNA synthetase 1 [Segniliparus rugosus ATCC BAA-974]
MVTRLSELFLRTLREDPADAEVPNHKLLVRGGYFRRVSPGVFAWLPLGLKALRQIENVVREEMDGIGGQEILLPALAPRQPYETSNRWTEYGDNLFRLKDRKGGDYLLAPTHEELFALLVKGEYTSYKDLPVILYQIQTKYRDEERPRAGILRGREFVMKDSYSFDVDEAGNKAAYHAHREAYQRIFDRLGISYVIVAATSGAMGGSASEEFLAESAIGEDTYVRCLESGYAANVEAVTTPVAEPVDFSGAPEAQTYDTGDTPTIATLVDWANGALGREVTAADTLKNVLLKVRQPQKGGKQGEWELLAVGVPGDREVDFKRLEAQLEPAEVELLTDEDFAANPFLVRGYIGPGAIRANGVRYLLDPRVGIGTSWITGADEKGKHVVGLVHGRDFTADGTIEAAEVREGDPSPDGAGKLVAARGIEIGHVFALGTKYTDAFSVDVLGENGKPARLIMGSYGIGVSRLVGVIAEQWHDEKGLRWPPQVAPFQVHVLSTGKGSAEAEAAEQYAAELEAHGLRVLLDDRKASPGVKFADAELLGAPVIVVVGRDWASEGKVELKERFAGESGSVDADVVVPSAVAALARAEEFVANGSGQRAGKADAGE